MASDDSGDVVLRGLGRGAAIGAQVGFLSPLVFCLLAVGGRDLGMALAGGLCLGFLGMVVGLVVGFVCALGPALILGWRREFFRRHVAAARFLTVSVGGLLLGLVASRLTSAQGVLLWLLFGIPLIVGIVLAANSADYILDGGARWWLILATGRGAREPR